MTQKPLTLEEAKQLQYGEHLYLIKPSAHYNNNTTGQVKIIGKPKTWKTRPNEVRIPAKYGLYEYFYITQDEIHMWSKDQP